MNTPNYLTLVAMTHHAQELSRLAAIIGWTKIIIIREQEPADSADESELIFRIAAPEGEPEVDPLSTQTN